jgi:signal transduction histidine kinase
MKLITRIYFGIGLVLFIFTIVTVSFLYLAQKVETEMQQVMRVQELIRLSDANQKTLIDMETGFRGYLLAENETFLQPYYNGIQKAATLLESMQRESNDPIEKRLLSEIETEGANWVHNFAQPIIDAKRKSLQNPRYKPAFDSLYTQLLKAGRGKEKMDLIRVKAAGFDAHEAKIKKQQIAELNDSLSFTRIISISLTSLAIVLGLLIAFLLGRTIHRRLTAMIELADQISQGRFDVKINDKATDEMSHLSRSLDLMAQKLKTYITNLTKMNRELDQFAYVVSHDLKAPLRAINNLAEWIAEDITDKDPDIQKNLQLMRGRAHRMENLINGILEYSKVGRKEVPKETFKVGKLLDEIVDSLAPPANMEIILPDITPELTTEKIFMQQVFTNLIRKSIKYNNKPYGRFVILARDT